MRLHPHLLMRRVGEIALASVPPDSLDTVGVVLRIEGTALAVFDALAAAPSGHESRGDLARDLARRFDAPPEQVRADLEPLLDGWVTAGIVIDDDAVAPETGAPR